LQNNEHAPKEEEMLARACYRGTVTPSQAAVGLRENLVP
jgi:hypothetical protein